MREKHSIIINIKERVKLIQVRSFVLQSQESQGLVLTPELLPVRQVVQSTGGFRGEAGPTAQLLHPHQQVLHVVDVLGEIRLSSRQRFTFISGSV